VPARSGHLVRLPQRQDSRRIGTRLELWWNGIGARCLDDEIGARAAEQSARMSARGTPAPAGAGAGRGAAFGVCGAAGAGGAPAWMPRTAPTFE
jgi:hypothetical protein